MFSRVGRSSIHPTALPPQPPAPGPKPQAPGPRHQAARPTRQPGCPTEARYGFLGCRFFHTSCSRPSKFIAAHPSHPRVLPRGLLEAAEGPEDPGGPRRLQNSLRRPRNSQEARSRPKQPTRHAGATKGHQEQPLAAKRDPQTWHENTYEKLYGKLYGRILY